MVDRIEKTETTSEDEHVHTTEGPVRPVRASGRPEVAVAPRRSRKLIVSIIVLIVVVLALLITAVALVAYGSNKDQTNTFGSNSYRYQRRDQLVANSPYGYGSTTQTTQDNSSVTTTVYNYLTGVVTAVGTNSITVAGNGKSTTITTNSSTTYDNSTKPAVNDTVSVAGTTSGSTTTATEISVNN